MYLKISTSRNPVAFIEVAYEVHPELLQLQCINMISFELLSCKEKYVNGSRTVMKLLELFTSRR